MRCKKCGAKQIQWGICWDDDMCAKCFYGTETMTKIVEAKTSRD